MIVLVVVAVVVITVLVLMWSGSSIKAATVGCTRKSESIVTAAFKSVFRQLHGNKLQLVLFGLSLLLGCSKTAKGGVPCGLNRCIHCLSRSR